MTDDRDTLAEEILTLINHRAGMTDSDHLAAVMMVIADIVGAIDCKQCREKAEQSVKEYLPDLLNIAMTRPISGEHHVH